LYALEVINPYRMAAQHHAQTPLSSKPMFWLVYRTGIRFSTAVPHLLHGLFCPYGRHVVALLGESGHFQVVNRCRRQCRQIFGFLWMWTNILIVGLYFKHLQTLVRRGSISDYLGLIWNLCPL